MLNISHINYTTSHHTYSKLSYRRFNAMISNLLMPVSLKYFIVDRTMHIQSFRTDSLTSMQWFPTF